MNGYGCRGGSASLFVKLIAMEMARVDSLLPHSSGVHKRLEPWVIYLAYSEEQKSKKWLPPTGPAGEKELLLRLTEPLVGSGTSGALRLRPSVTETPGPLMARRNDRQFSMVCDISIIWARDSRDNQVRPSIVENKTTPDSRSKKSRTRSPSSRAERGA